VQTFVSLTFGGGLNNNHPGIVRHNEIRDCINIDLDRDGMPSTRRGSKFYDTSGGTDYAAITESGTAKSLNGIHQFRNDDGTYKLIATAGTKIYYDNGSAFVALTGHTLTDSDSLLTQFCEASITSSSSVVFGTNNVDKPWYWDGSATSVSLLTATDNTPTKTKAMVWYQGYLIHGNYELTPGTGAVRYQNRIRWSNVYAPNTYDAGDSLPVGTHDDPIEALIPFIDYVLVLKKHSMWLMVPNYEPFWEGDVADPFRIQLIHPRIGCDAPRSVVRTDNEVVWFNKDGWYLYDGRGTNEDNVHKISHHIDLSGIEQSEVEKSHAVYLQNRDQIRTWVPDDEDNDDGERLSVFYSIHPYLVDQYQKRPAFTKNKLAVSTTVSASKCSCHGFNSSGGETVFLGTEDGRVVVMEQSTFVDLDAAMRSYLHTSYWDMRTTKRKKFHKVRVYQKAQACTMTVTQFQDLGEIHLQEELDFSTSSTIWGGITWPITWGSGIYVYREMMLDGIDRFTSFGFETNQSEHGLQLVRIAVDYDTADH
jgi:hypothetical protein